MEFRYSRNGLSSFDRVLQRFLETLPGLLSWVTLLGLMVLSAVAPSIAAVIMISFFYYWFIRLMYNAIFILIAFLRLWVERGTNWIERTRDLYVKNRSSVERPKRLRERISIALHERVKRASDTGEIEFPDEERLLHLVIIPVYRESREVFEPGIRALTESSFPSDRMILTIALEERAPEEIKQAVYEVQNQYRSRFKELFVVVHPKDLPGEAAVKGANSTFAAKHAARYFEENQIPFEDVIVSCFDADTVPGPEYFSCLTYAFITCPARNRASFQPVPLYDNNIWRVPFYARTLEMGSTVIQLAESTNNDLLVSFSSHSLSFKALVDVGYWSLELIPDDSAIYWKSLILFDGDFRVVPMPATLSMDATEAPTFFKTFVNAYRQKLRWAWGVENVPIAARGLLKNRHMSFIDKIRYIFKLFDTYFIWATWPFLLTIFGFLPRVFGRLFNLDAITIFNLGRISGLIFQLASINLVIMIVVTALFIFRGDHTVPLWRKLLYPVEWLLVPIITLFLSGMPALHAQTRLMFGRPLEFWAAEKVRTTGGPPAAE